jgi:hypothetical protein
MKKLLLFSAFIAIAFIAKSQSIGYKSFKVDIGFGYAIPSAGGNGTKAGVTFTIEPHYRLSDQLSAGLRLEGAGLGYKNSDDDIDVSLLNSYCATGEYYLMNGGFRPFVGAGAGFFSLGSVNVGSGAELVKVEGATKFGFFPRIGIETGHFRVSSDYNVLSDKAGYLAFKLGFFLGGGKK